MPKLGGINQNEMKIIAGKYKGRNIVSELKGMASKIKPTTSKTREAVFNIIFSSLAKDGREAQSCSFLDVCCGTGAMGIEAMSRGFSPVYFVDNDKNSLAITKNNITSICKDEGYKVINSDASKLIIDNCPLFDFVYIDPPYNHNIIPHLLVHIKQLIHKKSLVIIETAKDIQSLIPNGYAIAFSKHYSNCMILCLSLDSTS
ncbi:RsmD family RNA methyltransferase [Candidatus Bandiella euplotis]|uniref:RsmD family RNA methyltransferase n=1 Tax=Candidatus Bandiella euplotis TaxID=1664265 RepID=UPI002B25C416|nr:RsmD family RNA methyltransferase [Candidatus Bandiella woodruffii]